MAKRYEPRASHRTAREARNYEEEPAEGLWARANKKLVGAGAVATALVALLTLGRQLWPDSGSEQANRAATFTGEVRITELVRFSAYEPQLRAIHLSGERPAGLRPWGAAVAATENLPQTADPPEGNDTGPSREEPNRPTVAPIPSETAPTSGVNPTAETSPTASGAPDAVAITPALPSNPDVDETKKGACAELSRMISAEKCRKSQPVDLMARSLLRSASDHPDPPDTAQRKLVQILEESRNDFSSEPIGVVIGVKVELVGMRNRPVLLSWSMWNHGATSVYGEWLNTHLALQLVATSDRDEVTLTFWVPVPEPTGSYFIRSQLQDSGEPAVTKNSRTFS